MFDNLILSEPVVSALRLAATSRGEGRALNTSEVFLTLLRTDTTNPWHYVTLQTGDYDQLECHFQLDADGPGTECWEGVPLTSTLARALAYADELARGYQLMPVPPGLLALALVSEPGSGAARTVQGADLTHVELIELIHLHLLGGTLVDSTIFPPWVRSTPGPPHELPPASVRGSHGQRVDSAPWAAVGTGAFDLLRAAALRSDDGLRSKLKLVLLDDDKVFANVAPVVAALNDEPAGIALDRARDRFDTADPTPAQVIAAVTVVPSEKVRRFLWYLGLESCEVAALATDLALEKGSPQAPSGSATALMALVMTLNLVVSGLVIAHASRTEHLYYFGLAWLVWAGHPSSSGRLGLVIVGLLAWFVDPLIGGIHLVSVVLEFSWARAERQAFWGYSGVRLSLARFRRHLWRSGGKLPRLLAQRQRFAMTRRLPVA
ncbi:MAG: hypothetical protein ACR2KK_08930 [Acidimicrobiales bacterium]